MSALLALLLFAAPVEATTTPVPAATPSESAPAASPTAAAATPGSITGTVKIAALSVGSASGGPAEAVVLIEQVAGAAPYALADGAEIVQAKRAFLPRLLIVPVGATVDFPNRDDVLHNVFSGSPTKRFHLGRYGKGESKTVTFDQPGIVTVYCDIHPQMVSTILVVANAFVTHPDAAGRFTLSGVPPGEYRMITWFPWGAPAVTSVVVAAGSPSEIAVTLQEIAAANKHKHLDGSAYGGY